MESRNSAIPVANFRRESQSVALEIDLNETPLPSPREKVTIAEFSRDCVGGELRCAHCGELDGVLVTCVECRSGFHVRCLGPKNKCFKCLFRCGNQKSQVGSGAATGACSGGLTSRGSGSGGGLGLLDINASPPRETEGDGEGFSMDIDHARVQAGSKVQGVHGDAFLQHTLHPSMLCSDTIYMENRSAIKNNLSREIRFAGFDYEVGFHKRMDFNKKSSETHFGCAHGEKHQDKDNVPPESFIKTPNDIYLDVLREFISGLNGVLEEGWRVDFVYSGSRCKTCAVYCAPDGSRHDSSLKVAHHLGLIPKCNSSGMEDKGGGITVLPKGTHATKMLKEGSRSSRTISSRENKNMSRNRVNGLTPDVGSQSIHHNNSRNAVDVDPVADGSSGSQVFSDGFPVQFEDFLVTSVGKIDPRLSFHDTCLISPIGYQAMWHDKITGSLFVFKVLDGGDFGPIYRVHRYPCTKHLIPNASTVLYKPKCGPSDGKDKVESDDSVVPDMVDDDGLNIQLMLADNSPPPLYNDNSSGSSMFATEDSNFQNASSSTTESGLPLFKPRGITSDNFGRGDAIGEFSVDGESPSSAWEKVVKTLLQACKKAYKDICVLQFCCNHNRDGQSFNAPYPFDSLAKFCYLAGPINNIPNLILSDDELDASCELLTKWLQQDRFGLDMEFVQELIEELPGVTACSEYQSLNKRYPNSMSQTVGSGFLLANRKNDTQGDKVPNDCSGSFKRPNPSGKPLNSKLPPYLIGDVLQVYEFSVRFSSILGLDTTYSIQDLESELINPWVDNLKPVRRSLNLTNGNTTCSNGGILHDLTSYPSIAPASTVLGETSSEVNMVEVSIEDTCSRCTGTILANFHTSLLKVVIGDLLSKVVGYVDPNFGAGESKSRRGRKKEAENLLTEMKTKLDMLPINDITWPELARRYVLAVLCMEGSLDSTEVTYRESGKVFHCLQGDGGMLCGSLTGVVAMEADAMLLAEATRKIFGPVRVRAKDIELSINYKELDTAGASEPVDVTHDEAPEWAQVLEPVRKLPTNVGARIRNCVYQALDKSPPEWAREILLHSISKQVYKGNASGPTKRLVVSVLEDVRRNDPHKESEMKEKEKEKEKETSVKTVSDVVVKRCRIVLRSTVAEDDERVFCNLLGRTLLKPNDNDDEGLLGYPAMVSRPLDFRTIDLRLAAGVYDGSHEAFAEDVREVWQNIRTAYGDRPELTDLVSTLTQKFEELYEEEVLTLVRGIAESGSVDSSNDEAQKEFNAMLARTSESSLPKAPWEDGVCKVCGMDKDDDNVLLCDTCDSEYHTYCLDPPLARIPEGNWYCPSCLSSQSVSYDAPCGTRILSRYGKKRLHSEFTQNLLEKVALLANMMELKEYWELTAEERVFLIKFLCDEALSSAVVRDHFEQCTSTSADLQQKLRSLTSEWRNLKLREETLAANLPKEGETSDAIASMHTDDGGLLRQLASPSNKNSSLIIPADSEDSQQYWSFSKCSSEKPCSGSSTRIPNDFNGENGSGLSDLMQEQNNGSSNDHATPTCQATEDITFVQDNLKNDISSLHDSVITLETESLKVAVRKELLGRDSAGRLYWGFGSPGASQRVIVNGSWSVRLGKLMDYVDPTEKRLLASSNFLPSRGLNISGMYSCERSSWTCYRSDAEINELIDWLSDDDARERELKETIVQWQKHKPGDSANSLRKTAVRENALRYSFPETKARIVLQKKFGFSLEQEAVSNIKKLGCKGKMVHECTMYRCDCLELVGPPRYHCSSCHLTFCTSEELERHGDGKCRKTTPREEFVGSSKCKSTNKAGNSDGMRKVKKEVKGEGKDNRFAVHNEADCPFNYEEIRAKFSTGTALKDLVKDIGLIGANGTPSFVSEMPPDSSSSTLLPIPKSKSEVNSRDRSKDGEHQQQPTQKREIKQISDLWAEYSRSKQPKVERIRSKTSSRNKSLLLGMDKRRIICQSSLRPLTGKVCEVLRLLKVNLLDMDTALPEEALRPSRGNSGRRSTWRAFVKSARAIYEMVQATIILEDMIKTEYLKNDWWYWSSPSAAAKISTISALALRIYALDAAIIYEKPPSTVDTATTESTLPVSKLDKESSPNSHSKTRKSSCPSAQAMAIDLDPAEISKPKTRQNKRRKESAS